LVSLVVVPTDEAVAVEKFRTTAMASK